MFLGIMVAHASKCDLFFPAMMGISCLERSVKEMERKALKGLLTSEKLYSSGHNPKVMKLFVSLAESWHP